MQKLEQKIRHMIVIEGQPVWDDMYQVSVANLPHKFRMLDIDHYMGIECPRIHLRLYKIVMRAHDLDEMQMIMLFPLSRSGVAQRWYASLDMLRNVPERI